VCDGIVEAQRLFASFVGSKIGGQIAKITRRPK